MDANDKFLGMDCAITRRDFLNGTALAIGGFALAGNASAANAPYYPPALTGMRGQHDGSFEVMHAIRNKDFWGKAGPIAETGETYDLIVVGAGISGLTAAHLFRQQKGKDARILILDNHDDFGGHAKRNEFTSKSGKFLLGYGGSQSLQTPSYFSPAVKQLMVDLGVDTEKFKTYYNSKWLEDRGLGEAFFFAKEVFGTDALVKKTEKAADWVPNTPLNDKAKADLIALLDNPIDYFPGLDRDAKLELMSRLTYADFLTQYVKADPQVVLYFQLSTAEYFGCGIDAVTCADAWGNGNAGFDAMELGDKACKTMSPSGRLAKTDPDDYIFHFPDGNASIARLLVRALVPDALPGSTMEDIVLAKCDYSKLDVKGSPICIRLSSSAVRVKHNGEVKSAKDVEVVYSHDGKLHRAVAAQSVLALFHQAVPYIAPEVPEDQVIALKDQQKIPLVYTNVQIRNWQAFSKLGISGFESPGHYWDKAEIDFPVSMGGYDFADKPEDPMVLHLGKVPAPGGGAPLRDQSLASRYWVQSQSFADMERAVRDLLNRALGSAGFDAARDIEAITVNRWSHGYAYEYMRPWDQYWPDGKLPIETSRKGWGRIAIANADAGAYAYAHSAIDQAARAVRELLGTPEGAPAFADFPGPPRDMLEL
jgi:spermidine dehydrogenase